MRLTLSSVLILAGAAALVLVVATPEAERWVEELDAARAAERDAAAVELLRIGDDAVPALTRVIEDGSANARRRARALLDAIADAGSEESRADEREANALVRLALDREALVADGPIDRRLTELGETASHSLADSATRASKRGMVRSDLVEALGRHASPESLDVLTRLLSRERAAPGDVLAAARAMHGSNIVAPENVGDSLRGVIADGDAAFARAAARLLVAANGVELEELLTLSEHAVTGVRLEVARELGRRARNDEGAARLRELALDDETTVRVAALEALLDIPGRPAPEPALANVDHSRPAVRAAAATLLGRERTPAALVALERLQSDHSRRVRAAAERARKQVG